MPDERIRITTSIPKWHYDLLERWGYFKGKEGVAPMISDIVQARVEANKDQIDDMTESRSKALGITIDELKDKIKKESRKKGKDARKNLHRQNDD